jgi:hypothetical protein
MEHLAVHVITIDSQNDRNIAFICNLLVNFVKYIVIHISLTGNMKKLNCNNQEIQKVTKERAQEEIAEIVGKVTNFLGI